MVAAFKIEFSKELTHKLQNFIETCELLHKNHSKIADSTSLCINVKLLEEFNKSVFQFHYHYLCLFQQKSPKVPSYTMKKTANTYFFFFQTPRCFQKF